MITKFARLEFELFTKPSKSDFLRVHQKCLTLLETSRLSLMNRSDKNEKAQQVCVVRVKGLTIEDIHACFLFATKSLKNTEFMPLMAESS
jgi:hypothetical protein